MGAGKEEGGQLEALMSLDDEALKIFCKPLMVRIQTTMTSSNSLLAGISAGAVMCIVVAGEILPVHDASHVPEPVFFVSRVKMEAEMLQ